MTFYILWTACCVKIGDLWFLFAETKVCPLSWLTGLLTSRGAKIVSKTLLYHPEQKQGEQKVSNWLFWIRMYFPESNVTTLGWENGVMYNHYYIASVTFRYNEQEDLKWWCKLLQYIFSRAVLMPWSVFQYTLNLFVFLYCICFWSCCIMNSLVCILGNGNVDQIVSIFLALLSMDTYMYCITTKATLGQGNRQLSPAFLKTTGTIHLVFLWLLAYLFHITLIV